METLDEEKKSVGVSNTNGRKPGMEIPATLRNLLKQRGYSDKAIEEIWKWYDFSERKGVNF